jgi:hypothetical protein
MWQGAVPAMSGAGTPDQQIRRHRRIFLFRKPGQVRWHRGCLEDNIKRSSSAEDERFFMFHLGVEYGTETDFDRG